MSWVGYIVISAAVALLVWHLVRPNFRELRVSVAEFLPDPPASRAPRNRISLVPPVRSVPFLLRMVAAAALIAALFAHLLPDPPASGEDAGRRIRLLIDASPSMSVGDRMEAARDAARSAIAAAGTEADGKGPVCLDLVIPEEGRVVSDARIEPALAAIAPGGAGMPADRLLAPLALDNPGPCGRPTHAVVVTDLPPRPVPTDRFDGIIIWHQVGAPEANVALTALSVSGGGLSQQAAGIVLRARTFGEGDAPSVLVTTPQSASQHLFEPDPGREGGWLLTLPHDGAGSYTAELQSGGAWDGDDRIAAELTQIDRLAVDWQTNRFPAPAALAQGGPGSVEVTDYTGPEAVPTDRRVVAMFDGWPGSGQLIGAFTDRHPLLEGVNFDVFETVLPDGLSHIPEGFRPTIMSARPGNQVLVAVRAEPRSVLLPAPVRAPAEAAAISRLLLGNALAWVAGAGRDAASDAWHLDAAGSPVPSALFESDTARELAAPPDLSDLKLSPETGTTGKADENDSGRWASLLIALALGAFMLERLLGLSWRNAA